VSVGRPTALPGAPGTAQSCTYLFQPGTVVMLSAPGRLGLGLDGAARIPGPICQVTVTDDLLVIDGVPRAAAAQVDIHSQKNGEGVVQVSAGASGPTAWAPGTAEPRTSSSRGRW
jgi:hypothetical protein